VSSPLDLPGWRHVYSGKFRDLDVPDDLEPDAPAERMSITPFVEAAKSLAGKNTGALIAFQMVSDLKFYGDSGDLIDATVSKRLLMSIFNLGTLASQNVGAHLYTELGEGSFAYIWLVVISSFATAAIWLLVPMIHIERIEARAQRRR